CPDEFKKQIFQRAFNVSVSNISYCDFTRLSVDLLTCALLTCDNVVSLFRFVVFLDGV
ncbi:hypothetical protein BgiBS90_021721, partial [Biomphalaria glabrata]